MRRLRTELVLFTDLGRIDEYQRLARLSNNDSPLLGSYDEEVERAVIRTNELERLAGKVGVPVEEVLKNNLAAVPFTYALIDMDDGTILGVGCMQNYDFILLGAELGKDTALVAEIGHDPEAWAGLEFIGVDERFQGRGLGKKLVAGLLQKAAELGIENVGAVCAEDRLPFYERAGMELGCRIPDFELRRVSIGALDDGQEIVTTVVTDKGPSKITLGEILNFLDAEDRKADRRRSDAIDSLGVCSEEKIAAIVDDYPEIMPPIRISSAVMVRRAMSNRFECS